MDKEKFFRIFLVILGILVIINLIFLDLNFFKEDRKEITKGLSADSLSVSDQSQSVSTEEKEDKDLSCPVSCLEKIAEATGAAVLPTPKTIIQQSSQSSVKEFYIPLGSGSSSSTTWEGINNAEAYFDPKNYGKIQSMIFEASMRIPTGNGKVYARLYNVDDQNGLIETEIWTEGSGGIRVESSSFNLPSARRLYRVQLKTTMGYEAILDLARLKVTVK